MAGWKVIGMTPDVPQSQWHATGDTPDVPESQWHVTGDTPDTPPHAAPAQPEPDHTFLGDLAHGALGAGEIAGASIANIPGAIGNAAADFAARATGHTKGAHPFGTVQPGQAGRDFADRSAQLVEQGNDAIGMGDTVAKAVGKTDEAAHTVAQNIPDPIKNGLAAGGDALTVLGARAIPGMKIAPGPPSTSGVVSRVVRGTTTAAGDAEQGAALAARQAGYEQKGFVTSKGISGPGKVLAGDTAGPTAVNHNADVFTGYSSSEARVPHTSPLSYESLEQGRAAPNAVMERTGRALPEGNLDGPATIRANNAGAEITDTASQQQVANMRQLVAQPMSGPQRIQQLRQFRQEAYSRLGNEGANSTDQQAVGRAQLEMANAIEDHIGRNLPANGDVSVGQFQAARKALAKNYTVQSALRGVNDVDPNVLARIQRADPQLLDGDMETMASFANDNPEVVGRRTVLNAPGVSKDLSNVNPLKLGSLGSALTGGAGPALGRRLITGGPAAGRAAARAATPNAGVGDEFAPLQPQPPQPPEGMTASTPERPPPPPPGHPGGVPLADVLSTGVEQQPAAGLTAGPMGPQPHGEVPFRGSPEAIGARPVQGGSPKSRSVTDDYGNQLDLEKSNSPGAQWETTPERERVKLGDRLASPEDGWFTKNPQEAGAVGSQGRVTSTPVGEGSSATVGPGVPDGTMTRAPTGTRGTRSMRGPGNGPAATMQPGDKLGDYMVNRGGSDNASIGAASPEAINRGFRDVVRIDPDGNGSPVLRDVTQIDARAPKGHVLADKHTGEIIDRGGLNQRMAESQVKRWQARQRIGDLLY